LAKVGEANLHLSRLVAASSKVLAFGVGRWGEMVDGA
jgi:hypothetical protein